MIIIIIIIIIIIFKERAQLATAVFSGALILFPIVGTRINKSENK